MTRSQTRSDAKGPTDDPAPEIDSPRGPVPGLRIGAFLALGWVTHDLVRYAVSNRPANALELLPSSLVAVAIAAVVGWFCGRGLRNWVLVAGLAALGSVAPSLFDLELSRATIWIPRVAFLLACGFALTVVLRASFDRDRGTVRNAFGLGLLLCIAKTAFRHGQLEVSWLLLGLGFACLLIGLLRRPPVRFALTLLAVLGAVGSYAPRVLADLKPTRGDLPPVSPGASAGAPNLVFIVMDTVRADHLSAYGYERATTPQLERFAAEHATRYTNCRSTSPFTLPSHSSMFTGLFPSEHHAALPGISAIPLRTDVPTLAGRMRDAGFQTAAIVANDTYLNPIFGLDRGFEHFDDRAGGWTGKYLALGQLAGGDTLRIGHLNHREATEITDTALAWLDDDRREGPFFLFLNYLDAHSPYFPNDEHRGLFEDTQPVDPMNPPGPMRQLLYDREIAYVDSQIGRLFDGLRERGLFDGTAVIVTADHGEDFLEHDIIEHCWNLYDSLVRVPLFLKPADGRREATNDQKISVAELYGLALRQVGLDAERSFPDHGFVGEWYPTDPISDGYTPWIERTGFDAEAHRVAWLEGDVKWIVSSSGEVLAFDLIEDPGEERPLEIDEAARGRALDRASSWWAARPLPEGDGSELDQDTKAQLEALGYG